MNEPLPVLDDSRFEDAVQRLEIIARLEGPNGTLMLDIAAPRAGDAPDRGALFLMRAAAELHDEIQSRQDASDIEETLESALRADDSRGIDEGLQIYRSLLSTRLRDIWRGNGGEARLAELSKAKVRPWET